MKQYLDFMRHVRRNGAQKSDRTGTGTLSVFGYQMRFDLAAGFPLVDFHTHLKEGLGKAESLQMAQADIRRQFPQPYYWAGFVLMGDPGESNNVLQARTMK